MIFYLWRSASSASTSIIFRIETFPYSSDGLQRWTKTSNSLTIIIYLVCSDRESFSCNGGNFFRSFTAKVPVVAFDSFDIATAAEKIFVNGFFDVSSRLKLKCSVDICAFPGESSTVVFVRGLIPLSGALRTLR